MKKQYPYSNDKDFLSKIDLLPNQEQWVKITLLEYKSEVPLEDIEGQIVNGTLNKDGSSIVRRTCSLSCNIDAFTYDPGNVKAKYSISKKIYLELGITNDTSDYKDEEIIWFPQGVFFITSFAISSSATGATTINVQFKDKMAMLDGTVGGVLPATTRFDIVTSVVNGVTTTKKQLVYDIIMETVNHFGGEDLTNIIIDDIPQKAKRLIRWNGSESVWIYPIQNKPQDEISYDICFNSDIDEKKSAHTPIQNGGAIFSAKEYKQNQDIGYMYEDFVYDDELTFAAGSKVTDVLDKIKGWLGNYEYFYDEQGQFHFQEIKNYLNNSQSSYIWDRMNDMKDTDYLHESNRGKAVYNFNDNTNLVSITNTPLYENIKNDYIVEGTTDRNGIKYTCRYHLVIDDKPSINTVGYDNVLIYKDPVTEQYTITQPVIVDPEYSTQENRYIWSLPEFAEDGRVYGLLDEPQVFTFDKEIKELSHFSIYYNELVEKENAAIRNESRYVLNNHPQVKDYLHSLLEDYMSYTDTTPYKTQYEDVIRTLSRQLRRYSLTYLSQRNSTKEYRNALYNKYSLDIDTYSPASTSSLGIQLSKYGGLLYQLYCLFSYTSPSYRNGYLNTSYWPAINTSISSFKSFNSGMTFKKMSANVRRDWINWCNDQIEAAQIKQKQLDILIQQYGQIISNFNALIKPYDRKKTLTDADKKAKKDLENERDLVQYQIDMYQEQLDLCGQRSTTLYAVLTALGKPDAEVGATYVTIKVAAPGYVSSFWYYDTDDSKETYGWNQLEWDRYHRDHVNPPVDSKTKEPLNYYYDGLGSMTYIDYNSIDFWDGYNYNLNTTTYGWDGYTTRSHSKINSNRGVSFFKDESNTGYLVIDNEYFKFVDDTVIGGDAISRFTNEQPINVSNGRRNNTLYYWQFSDSFPSMNRYSNWYKNYYINYAKDKKLSYFATSDIDGWVPPDWRLELIMRGMQAQANGTDPGYYYQELVANWPMVYDFRNSRLIPSSTSNVDYFVDSTAVILGSEYDFYIGEYGTGKGYATAQTQDARFKETTAEITGIAYNYENAGYYYFFDMIDSSSPRWGGYSVNNIGRRTNVDVSNSVNCIFAPETPNYAFLNVSGLTTKERAKALTDLEGVAENIIQVTDDFYNNFATGGLKQSAYEQIKYDLQQHTSYQNTISLTARPCFYLEPNVRVGLDDESTGTVGDFIVKSISIPLGAGNNMSVSMSEAIERM